MSTSENNDRIVQLLEGLQTQITTLQTDMNASRQNIQDLLNRVTTLEQRHNPLDGDLSDIPDDLNRRGRRDNRVPYRHNPVPRYRERERENFGPQDDVYLRQEERLFKNIKLDVPTFDGRLDPVVFSQWIRDMDRYFNWYRFTKERKVEFASMRLSGNAQLFWEIIE